MSKFRTLVEDIRNQQTYRYLTPDLQQALNKEIEKRMDDVDIRELPSTYYDANPYDVEPQLIGTSGGWFNDTDDEVWDAACELMQEYIKADGVGEYLWDYLTPEQRDDEEFQAALTKEAIDYIETQK